MDFRKIRMRNFIYNEEMSIKSTRIRVARNLRDDPFGAKMTREQRNSVE